METILVESAAGTKYAVRAEAAVCGDDLSVTVCGGTRAHVGAVSLAQYEPERDSATVSTLCVYTHRDGEISALLAKELSRALRCTVTATVGIHIDDASPEELKTLSRNCAECCASLIEQAKLSR